MGLFGCECREGQAASAPLLRPHGNDDREGGHPVDDPLPTFLATMECEPHDPDLLPHLHSADDILRLFPTIDAAPGPLNDNDYTVDGGVAEGAGEGWTSGQRLRARDCLQHPLGSRES